MTAATPKKLVHWALNVSLSDLGSPFSDAGSSESCSSTSSLQYVNSQLLAHGFTHGSGLSLDGLGKEDADKVVKCILGMLSQRIDDMSRTEDLTTKLRTLSYDHERLTSMYKTEAEKSGNAEREMNTHKSRLAAATKSLQSSENAHKHTTAELQRTRTTLISLRATHQTEIKKLEKEKERMVERWSKLSDNQLKAGTLPAGLSCANLHIVEASDVQLRGKGQGFLEVALEQAEAARKELFEQNRKLRGILLSAANELQHVLHAVRTGESNSMDEPTSLTHSALFPSPSAEATGETFSTLFRSLRDTISLRMEPSASVCNHSCKASSSTPMNDTPAKEHAEVERLQAVIDKLRSDLEEAQRQAASSAAQVQELFDRFAEEQAEAATHTAEMSMDLMTAPARDEERQRLDARFKELEAERQKFTEAAVRLGKEKAALEADRLKLLEEKRSWQVDMMLAELPPTPAPGGSIPTPIAHPVPAPVTAARQSARKSPRKLKSKAASPRKTRVSRRSSGFASIALDSSSPKKKQKVAPPFETEVLPSSVAVPKSPARQLPEFKTSMDASPAPPPPFLAGSFILPPPSPAASLPSREGGGTPLPPIPPLPRLEIPPASEDISDESMDTTPDPASSAGSSTSSGTSNNSHSQPILSVPQTPVVRPFPMAKPFATRMIHAYSPVKPSPLSRILMLANSPDSPEAGPALASLPESAAEDDSIEQSAPVPIRSLAEELGVSEDDDSPFRVASDAQGTKRKAHPSAEPPERRTQPSRAKDKGKARADAQPAPARGEGGVKRAKLANGAKTAPDAKKPARAAATATAKPTSSKTQTTRSRTGSGSGSSGGSGGKAPPRPKGGARRVPVGSAEAAPVPTWRG